MTALRQRMLEDLRIRNYAPTTVACYIRSVAEFAQHFNKPPDQLGPEEIRAWQLFLLQEKRVKLPTYIQAVCALRFFYQNMLHRRIEIDRIPTRSVYLTKRYRKNGRAGGICWWPMSLRFRRSIRIAPGVHVNLGLHGAGLSVGPRGLHRGGSLRHGMYTSAGIPGTGIYAVRHIRRSPGEHPKVAGSAWPVILPLAVLLFASCVRACA